MMKRIHLFAVKEDILPVLQTMEGKGAVKYIRMFQSGTSDYESFTHGAELPDLGKATSDSSMGCETFLVTKSEVPVDVRPVRLNSGVTEYDIDQLTNPDSVIFTPGGM